MANPVLYPAEEQLAFYTAIGMAITQWAFIEHGLLMVATQHIPDECGIGAGFFSVENFRSKLAFADKLVMSQDGIETFEAEWVALREHVRGLSSLRNQIAHGRLIYYATDNVGRRMALVPYFPPKSKKPPGKGKPPNGSLCVRDIDLASKQFGRAYSRLASLHQRLRGEEDYFAELAQRELKPQTLAQLRRQIYAMLPQREESFPQ